MSPLEILSEAWRQVKARPDGPLALRFYLQPIVAILLAARDGVHDARAGKPAYLWSVFMRRHERAELIRAGWASIRKVAIIAFLLDVVYQLIVLRRLAPVQGLIVAIVLAVIPYAVVRGPTDRVVRRLLSRPRPRHWGRV